MTMYLLSAQSMPLSPQPCIIVYLVRHRQASRLLHSLHRCSTVRPICSRISPFTLLHHIFLHSPPPPPRGLTSLSHSALLNVSPPVANQICHGSGRRLSAIFPQPRPTSTCTYIHVPLVSDVLGWFRLHAQAIHSRRLL